ncbi:MAG TPA: hypothetical protein PLC54_03325 [Spirochaetales bacterium]|nr:hypothetical protein [Spirochaetales bacterium]
MSGAGNLDRCPAVGDLRSMSKLVCVLVLVAVALVPGFAQGTLPAGTVLEDQFGLSVDVSAAMAGGKLVLALSAERDAADRLTEWSIALAGKLPAGARLLLVANLSGVPFFVPKSSIIKQLKEDYPTLSVILDWKGVLAKALGMGKLKNLAEAWSAGKRLARAEGTADAARAVSLAAALR